MKALTKLLLSRPEIASIVVAIALAVGLGLSGERFMTEGNMRVILAIVPELGLIALGAAMLMISGEFDLSVGSVFAMGTVMPVILVANYGFDPWLSFAIATGAALLIGYFNAFVTLTFRIPSFITTLGTLFIVRSASVVFSGGYPPRWPKHMPDWVFVGYLTEGGVVRASLLWYLGIAIVLGWVLHRTNFGNWIYATGSHKQSAQDMGIDVRRVKMTCFMICSTLATWAGILQALRSHSAYPSVGNGYEMQAIAACVIGGVALFGGFGSILAPIIGIIIIRMVDNGVVMARVDSGWFKFVIGTLTVGAVVLNVSLRRRAERIRLEDEAATETEEAQEDRA